MTEPGGEVSASPPAPEPAPAGAPAPEPPFEEPAPAPVPALPVPPPLHAPRALRLGRLVGMSLLTWLFVELAWTCFSTPGREPFGAAFGGLALAALLVALPALWSVVLYRRLGLTLDETGIRNCRARPWGLSSVQRPWSWVREVRQEGPVVVFSGDEGADLTTASPGDPLEAEPDLVAERGREFLDWSNGAWAPSQAVTAISGLHAAVAAAACRVCGKPIEPVIGAAVGACTCGEQSPLFPDLATALERVGGYVGALPQHRLQVRQDFLRRVLTDEETVARWPVKAGWLTAALWVAVSLVGLAAELAEPAPSRDLRLVILSAVLAASAVGLSLLTLRGLRWLACALLAPLAPLPKEHGGAKPRCRLCGLELLMDGPLKRCGWCKADNAVLGPLRPDHRPVLDALREALVRGTTPLLPHQRTVERAAVGLYWAGVLQALWLHLPLAAALEGHLFLLGHVTLAAGVLLVALLASAGLAVRAARV